MRKKPIRSVKRIAARKKPRIHSVKEIVALIHAGAERLLQQAQYSAEYLLDEGSEIAEANLVVHLASTFINDGHAVWAEVPLVTDVPKTTDSRSRVQEVANESETKEEAEQRGRFDLSIDLDYESSASTKSLKIEAKRIAQSEESEKIAEIVADFRRMESWRGAPPRESKFPFNVLREYERYYGALAVVLQQACRKDRKIRTPSLFHQWMNLKDAPTPPGPECLAELRKILANGKRGFVPCDYFDGRRRLVALYAVFTFGEGQTYMDYDNVDLVVSKKPRLNVRQRLFE